MRVPGKRQKGLSLIEMLVALVIGAIIMAGVYRTFAVQKKSFVVQDEVSQAQQSVRAVMDLIARDIRMAGFGRPDWIGNSVTVASTKPANFTLVGAFSGSIARLGSDANIGDTQITLDQNLVLSAGDDLLLFESDTSAPALAPPLRFTPVRVWTDTDQVVGSNVIDIDSDGSTGGTRDSLGVMIRQDALVYRVETVTYSMNGTDLVRTGGGGNSGVLARNVHLDPSDGLLDFEIVNLYNPAVPETFGSYQISLTIETRTNDPDFISGVRTRTLTSTIQARNMST